MKHLDVFIFFLSFRLIIVQAHEQNSIQHLDVHRLLGSQRNHSSTTNSPAQARDAKEEGAEDIANAETNRQFEPSLIQ